jgi:hypothetical protein
MILVASFIRHIPFHIGSQVSLKSADSLLNDSPPSKSSYLSIREQTCSTAMEIGTIYYSDADIISSINISKYQNDFIVFNPFGGKSFIS